MAYAVQPADVFDMMRRYEVPVIVIDEVAEKPFVSCIRFTGFRSAMNVMQGCTRFGRSLTSIEWCAAQVHLHSCLHPT